MANEPRKEPPTLETEPTNLTCGEDLAIGKKHFEDSPDGCPKVTRKRKHPPGDSTDEKRSRPADYSCADSHEIPVVPMEAEGKMDGNGICDTEEAASTSNTPAAADAANNSSSCANGGNADAEAEAAAAAAGVSGFQLDRESLVFAAECHMAVLQDEDGDTPLHLAVVQANKHLVHHLVYLISRSSRNVDISNKLRQTPLHLAVITGQADLITLLLANNASSNLPDRLGRTGLHLAAERNYADCCVSLLESREVELDIRNFDGYTPVHTAVFHSSFGALGQLIAAGASVNPRDGKSGRSPLHHAAENGNSGMVQFLITHGANIDASTYSGNTPLHSAAGRGHEHIVSLLVTAGADTHVQNTEGDVAADIARCRNAFRAPAAQPAVTA